MGEWTSVSLHDRAWNMESRNWLKEDIEDEAEAITQKQQSWKQKCQSRWQGLGPNSIFGCIALSYNIASLRLTISKCSVKFHSLINNLSLVYRESRAKCYYKVTPPRVVTDMFYVFPVNGKSSHAG